MGNMFNRLFAMLSRLFSAGELLAASLENVATWTEESSGAFVDLAREQRKQAAIINNARTQIVSQDPLKAVDPISQAA